MLVTVLVPQNRVGGLDVLFSSLEKQTHQDFEVVLIDAIYEHRPILRNDDGITPLLSHVRVVHLPPAECDFPWANYCRSLNLGIAHARGEIVVYAPDYAWFAPDCLAAHVEFHERHRGEKVGLMLDYRYVGLPKLKDVFPCYGPQLVGAVHGIDPDNYDYVQDVEADRYAADVASGKLDSCMWSLFEDPITWHDQLDKLPVTLEHKKSASEAHWDPNYCSLKNESIPLEGLLAVNGHDEDFDQSHGWQDSEICWRLVNQWGMQWWSRPGGLMTVVDPRPKFYFRKQKKKTGFNGRMLDEKKKGRWLANEADFNLRDVRRWTLPDLAQKKRRAEAQKPEQP